jgi:hypothetical protein
MSELKTNGQKRWDPNRWADDANESFIRLAKSLMQVISWDVSSSATENRHTRREPVQQETAKGEGGLSNHGERGVRYDTRPMAAVESGASEAGLRDLFHHRVERRLSAVRYLREHGGHEAIPLLESVFAAEEEEEVRRQITDALTELEKAAVTGQGEEPVQSAER